MFELVFLSICQRERESVCVKEYMSLMRLYVREQWVADHEDFGI